MNRIKVSQNSYLDEYVDPITYMTEEDHGLSKVDFRLFGLFQLLRSFKGSSIGINNWWGHWMEKKDTMTIEQFNDWCDNTRGVYIYSGFRPKWCPIGASKSKHKLGQAIDPKGDQEVLYKIVHDNALLFYQFGLRRLEDISITKGWLHMDVSESRHTDGKIRVIDRVKHVMDINVYG